MKNKLQNAISNTAMVAAVILFIGWLAGSVSGWWWFSLFLTAIFTDELE